MKEDVLTIEVYVPDIGIRDQKDAIGLAHCNALIKAAKADSKVGGKDIVLAIERIDSYQEPECRRVQLFLFPITTKLVLFVRSISLIHICTLIYDLYTMVMGLPGATGFPFPSLS